ncbi:choice-of-anchor A family protein [Aliagarivorans taiwanensis]|uniref:choice-of-anchor A family protein n=1 Tax=Aliagarivorans taiwanensis TaxID=561966 RepID=UPI00040AA3CA|nr:choice-of-anchor A family protein [Aliagarivorans taiwanensis]
MRFVGTICGVLAVLTTSATAFSSPLTLMSEYNLIVFNNLTTDSEVEGKAMIMGDLNGPASNYAIHLDSAQGGELGLVVGGDINSQNINVNQGYSVALGGDANGNINLNGGGSLLRDVTDFDFADIQQQLSDFSVSLSELESNSNLIAPTVCCGPASLLIGADDIAVFNIDGESLFSNSFIQQFDVDFGGFDPAAIVINVAGTDISDAALAGNAVGQLVNDNVRERIVWNFFEAETISLNKLLNGSLLAPYAHLTNSTPIEGSVVVSSFQQNGEIHLPTFSGEVTFDQEVPFTPINEPGTGSVLLFAGLILLARRVWRSPWITPLGRSSQPSFA